MSPVLKAFVFDRDPDFVVRVPHFRPPLPEEGILIFLPQFPGLFSFVQLVSFVVNSRLTEFDSPHPLPYPDSEREGRLQSAERAVPTFTRFFEG